MTTLFAILIILGALTGIYFLAKKRKSNDNQTGTGSSSGDNTTQE